MEEDIRRQLDARQYDAAFGLLLKQFQDRVFRLALSMVRNQSQAEDIAQDVFFKIWKNLSGFHGGASLSTWIYTITRNTCLTELKKRAAHPTVSLEESEWENSTGQNPVLQVSDKEAGMDADVQILLAELPEKYRQVITLFYLEQKAYEEVSQMLSLPLGTVKTYIFRAKKELVRIAAKHHFNLKPTGTFSSEKKGTNLGRALDAVPEAIQI